MKRSRLLRAGFFAAMLAATGLGGSSASAQGTDPQQLAAAQAIFQDAMKAMEAKDYATACPKLEEVVRLVPEGMGARLSLAECYEGAGKLASAWSMYAAVAAAVKDAARQKTASERAEALRPKLAEVTVEVPEELRTLEGLEVRWDRVPIGAAQWGQAIPIDKGNHVLTATAKGKRPWEKAFQVANDGEKIGATVGPLENAPKDVATLVAEKSAPPTMVLVAAPWGAQRMAGVALGSAGIVGLGLGAFFGGWAVQRQSAADGHCYGQNLCDATGFSALSEAHSSADWSTGFLVGGGLLLAGGFVVYFTAPKPKVESSIAFSIGPRGGALQGTF